MSVGSVGLVLYVSRCRAVRCELSASELSTNRYIRIHKITVQATTGRQNDPRDVKKDARASKRSSEVPKS